MRARHAADREQALLHVVVRDHREVGGLADALGAHRARPGVRLDDLRHVAEELAHLADALRALVERVAPVLLGHDRAGQERRELGAAAVRADGRAAAALRRAERLVQHEHAGVEAELARADLAHHAVEVRVVVEAEAAGGVHRVDPLRDLRVVDAHVVRVADHQRGRPVGDCGPQRLERRVAVLLERQRDDVEPGRRRGRGVARVRLDRRDHLGALRELAARRVVGAGHAGVRVGRVGAAAGLEHELVHARELAQDQVEPVDDLERALQRVRVLVRVQLRRSRAGATSSSPRRGLYFIVQVPKRLTPIIPSVICDEVQVVALHLELGQLGQRRAPSARRMPAGTRPCDVAAARRARAKQDAAAALAAELHHERLVPDGRVVLRAQSSLMRSPPRAPRRGGRCRPACAPR